ncbi:MAG: hypothetical protein P1V20_03545 [Verrucomicrobiales bacterium]|nr:hypothetical protein [Verrucomicrobiales bacterium]
MKYEKVVTCLEQQIDETSATIQEAKPQTPPTREEAKKGSIGGIDCLEEERNKLRDEIYQRVKSHQVHEFTCAKD